MTRAIKGAPIVKISTGHTHTHTTAERTAPIVDVKEKNIKENSELSRKMSRATLNRERAGHAAQTAYLAPSREHLQDGNRSLFAQLVLCECMMEERHRYIQQQLSRKMSRATLNRERVGHAAQTAYLAPSREHL